MLQGYLMLVILAGGLLSMPLTLWLIRRYRKRYNIKPLLST